jgi:hypothetical protein
MPVEIREELIHQELGIHVRGRALPGLFHEPRGPGDTPGVHRRTLRIGPFELGP